MWEKQLNGVDKLDSYFCSCGEKMDFDLEYDPDTGTFTCFKCGEESPDIDNIQNLTGN